MKTTCGLAIAMACKYTETQDDKALGLCFLPLVRLVLDQLQMFMYQEQTQGMY